MDKNFKLIQQLQNPSKKERLLPKGIKYQEYTVVVEKQNVVVYIPLRECNDFEHNIYTAGEKINFDTFTGVLRKCRGIRG